MSVAMPVELHERLLVIDDNEASLYATSRVLRAAGFEVLEGVSGQDALRLADGVDLVVLDINLPDMDGFEVCRRLRAQSTTAYLPILHLSATFTGRGDMAQGLQAGADSYLAHPVDPPVLIATVRTLLFARQADLIKRSADARFRTVFELASSGFVLFDGALICRDANPAFCKMTGRTRPEIVEHTLGEFIDPDYAAELAQLRQAVRQQGTWQGLLPVRRPDGERAYVEWRIATEPGNGLHIADATDVTERRGAEAERERLLMSERAARAEAELSNRLKDEFLAALSHELRNPLNAILGWAAVLRRDPNASPTMLHGLEVIERNSRVQAHLIADLLDFAGIRFGKMHLDIAVISPAATVRAAVDVVATQARAKNVSLNVNIGDPSARVEADEARLQQVVWNLLTNSIKFTPAGGRIHISANRDGPEYLISVTDSGRGISAEFLPHIFDRFMQQDSGTQKSFAGLGIGLTIVKHLVDMHQGSIEASSEGEGHGATFRVRLPLTQATDETGSTMVLAPLTGLSVLVVEDDADARALIARFLGDAGASVRAADSASAALAAVAEQTPHVLISDISMPKEDGYQLLRALRAAGHGAERLPAIALTAFSRPDDKADAIAAGFQQHLSKPVNVRSLIGAVNELGRAAQR